MTDRLLIRATGSAGQTAELRIKGVATIPNASKACVTLAFDDSYESIFGEAKPVLDRFGFNGTLYHIPDAVGGNGYMTEAQVEILHDSGWDIAGHHQTNLGTMNTEDRTTALKDVSDYLRNRGYRGSDHFAYPNGVHTAAVVADVRKFFSTGRTINWMNQPRNYIDEMRINALSLSNLTSPATVFQFVDDAIANGHWLIITFHKIVTPATSDTEYSVANFTTIIEGLAARGVDVLPMTQAIRQADKGDKGDGGHVFDTYADGTSILYRESEHLGIQQRGAAVTLIALPDCKALLKNGAPLKAILKGGESIWNAYEDIDIASHYGAGKGQYRRSLLYRFRDTMISRIKSLIAELFRPTSKEETAYNRASQAVWHSVLGAAMMMLLQSYLIVALIYASKELFDFYNGGTIADSLEDLTAVMLGAAFAATSAWPFFIIALSIAVFAFHAE